MNISQPSIINGESFPAVRFFVFSEVEKFSNRLARQTDIICFLFFTPPGF